LIFNTITLVVEESVHVKFNDGLTFDKKLLDLEDDFEDMQIGSFVPHKESDIKHSNEILPQTKGS